RFDRARLRRCGRGLGIGCRSLPLRALQNPVFAAPRGIHGECSRAGADFDIWPDRPAEELTTAEKLRFRISFVPGYRFSCSSLNSTLRTILARVHVSDTDGFSESGILSVIGVLQQ